MTAVRSSLIGLTLFLNILGQSPGLAQTPGPHAAHELQFGLEHVEQEAYHVTYPRDLIPRTGLREPSHVVFGYHPYWNGTAWQSYNYEMLTHLAWFALSMNASGNITNAHGWPINSMVDLAHSHGVKVIVTVTLFDNDDIGNLLASATARSNAINNLIARVNQGNADGVNIDFEFVPTSARADFNTFIHDLTEAFHDQIPGSEVSIAMPSVDWWNSYDYNYLSDNSDGLMIMAYGYYYGGSANAGPLSPLNSGLSSWYIRRTISDYLTKTGDDASQLILGLPWYGYDWPVDGPEMQSATGGNGSSIVYSQAEANAQSYGKNYNSTAPSAWYNYNSGGYHQVWYDDSLSLASKYNYITEMDLKGLGIWALGYDGNRPEIWGGLSDAFGATAAPLPPQYFTVKNLGTGDVLITCSPTTHAEDYLAYHSEDGGAYTLIDSSSSPDILISGLATGETHYFKVATRNGFGTSGTSEVLGTFLDPDAPAQILVVHGFERTQGTTNQLDYILEHGEAIASTGRGFDGASNDAVYLGAIDLTGYVIVDWISGEEATATVSFSPQEQDKIMAYLESGGRMLISGSEIGYDLDANGSASDQSFYHQYFKADYLVDDTGVYSTYGTSNGIFSGITSAAFDNGSQGTYDVDYPDGIKPFAGSVSNLRFNDVEYDAVGGAGIQYLGEFGSSSAVGGIVHLSVGFEAFYPQTRRELMMSRILNFLETSVNIETEPTTPTEFQVSTAYPNPFNSEFIVNISSPFSDDYLMELFDLKGRRIWHEKSSVSSGITAFSLNPSAATASMSSGVYILRVTGSYHSHFQRITYLK